MWFHGSKDGRTEESCGCSSQRWSLSMWQVWFRSNEERGTEESCGDYSQGWDYQCDKCNLTAVINKWMLKQFVVVIPNV